MTYRKILLTAGVIGMLAVVLGAFGAHSLKDMLPLNKLAIYKTGVTYQFYHVLALLIVGLLIKSSPSKFLSWSAICFCIGILCFSGSLYLLATREIIGLTNYRWLGPITPIGGVFFILGWGFIVVEALRNTDK